MTDDIKRRRKENIDKLITTIEGLRIEVEGWRTHTASTGDFLLIAIQDLTRAVHALKDALK